MNYYEISLTINIANEGDQAGQSIVFVTKTTTVENAKQEVDVFMKNNYEGKSYLSVVNGVKVISSEGN